VLTDIAKKRALGPELNAAEQLDPKSKVDRYRELSRSHPGSWRLWHNYAVAAAAVGLNEEMHQAARMLAHWGSDKAGGLPTEVRAALPASHAVEEKPGISSVQDAATRSVLTDLLGGMSPNQQSTSPLEFDLYDELAVIHDCESQ